MSANDPQTVHEVEHTGPIKTPQQLLAAVFFSFVVPVFAIIGLVYFVISGNLPAAGADSSEKDIAQRIQKVGFVEIRDANRALKSGEEVYKAQCAACHTAGVAGAPKFGDTGGWAPRIQTGFQALWNSALKGKGAMAAQSGGEHNDVEIGRAVAYLTASAGAKFAEPAAAPAAATAGASAPAVAVAAGPSPDVVAALAAANKGTAAQPVAAAAGAGEALYKQACVACHASGVAGSPKLGDQAAWAPRLATGIDAMTASVIKGKGAMPPKGGSTAADADIRAAVEYMAAASK